MAKGKTNNSEGLQRLLKQVCDVEGESLPGAKDVLAYRNDLRARLKQMLEDRTPLPANSEFYAGLKRTEGRVDYRAALEDLRETGKVDDAAYSELLEKHRKPSLRLKYGSIKDNSAKRLWQSEFEFITPDGVLDR